MKLKSLIITSIASGGLLYYTHHEKRNILKASASDLKLEKVYIIFRHGARTYARGAKKFDEIIGTSYWDAGHLMKTLPHVDIDYTVKYENGNEVIESTAENYYKKNGTLEGGCLTGQLTTVGQQNAYELGEWIGKTYIQQHQLLSPIFNQDELYITTSNISRTIFSAKCLLAGMYGKDNIKETPLMTTRKSHEEYIYPNWFCISLKDWSQHVIANSMHIFTHQKPLANELQNKMNLDTKKRFNFHGLNDFIACRKAHGMSIPEYLIQHEKTIHTYASQVESHSLQGHDRVTGLRRSIGKFVEELCKSMEERSCKKMYLYSAHDTTLMALLMVLDQWNNQWPLFSASICFEVYSDTDNNKYVRVLYNGEALILDNDAKNQYLPLYTFLTQMNKFRVVDWSGECTGTSDGKTNFNEI